MATFGSLKWILALAAAAGLAGAVLWSPQLDTRRG